MGIRVREKDIISRCKLTMAKSPTGVYPPGFLSMSLMKSCNCHLAALNSSVISPSVSPIMLAVCLKSAGR